MQDMREMSSAGSYYGRAVLHHECDATRFGNALFENVSLFIRETQTGIRMIFRNIWEESAKCR